MFRMMFALMDDAGFRDPLAANSGAAMTRNNGKASAFLVAQSEELV
jgi:hypothetical protein